MKKNLLFIFLSFFALCIFSAIGGVLLFNSGVNEEIQQTEEEVEAYEYYAEFKITQTYSGCSGLSGNYMIFNNGVWGEILTGNLKASVSQEYSGVMPSETSNPSTNFNLNDTSFSLKGKAYCWSMPWDGDTTVTFTLSFDTSNRKSGYALCSGLSSYDLKFSGNNSGTTTKTKEITITWSPDYWWGYFHLNYDSNGSDSSYASNTIYNGSYWTFPSDPTRTGYDFAGWYTERSGGDRVTTSTVFWNYTSQHVYAHWTPKSYQIDINVLSPSGEQDYASGTFDQYVSYTSSRYDDVSDQGHSYVQTGSYVQISDIKPATGMKISSVYANNSPGSLSQSGSTYTYTISSSPSIDPGGGWDDAIIIQMEWDNFWTNINIYSPDGNEDYSSGTMTVNYNGSYVYGANNEEERYLPYNGYISVSDISPATGMHLSSVSGATHQGNGVYKRNVGTGGEINIYMAWNTYSVVYNANGGSGSAPGPQNNIKYNEDLELLDNTFTRTGYTFQGWSTSSGNNNTVNYTAGQTVSNLTSTDGGEVTLYAVWKANTYNLSYELNGGSHGTSHPSSATYDSAFTLSYPTKTGYTFAGWSASNIDTSAAIHGATQWTNGNDKTIDVDLKNLTPTNGATVTLTAHWTPIKYNVNLYRNLTASDTTYETLSNVEYDSNIEIVSNFQNSGKILAGWSKTRSDTSPTYITGDTLPNLTTTDRATINLYAIWINAYTETSNIEAPTAGSGATNSPYLVSTPGQLAWIASQVNFDGRNQINVKLTSNIILDSNINWNPIGTKQNPYKGIFDGNGYAISGVSTKTAYLNAQGLFGYVQGGIIENLFVSNANIKGHVAGGLIGEVLNDPSNSTTIQKVYINSTVSGESKTGGVVGKVNSGARVEILKSVIRVNLNKAGGAIIGDGSASLTYTNIYVEAASTQTISSNETATRNNVIMNINGTKTINGSFSTGWIISANGTPIPEGLTWLEEVSNRKATIQDIENWRNS